MGKVIVNIKLTNHADQVLQERNLLPGQPRSVQTEALVDTGATKLYLKPSIIQALGLKRVKEIESRTTNGIRHCGVFEPVQLQLHGRDGIFSVVDVGEDVPNFVGQIPLEDLDFVVDPKAQKIIPNPEHGGRQMTEEF